MMVPHLNDEEDDKHRISDEWLPYLSNLEKLIPALAADLQDARTDSRDYCRSLGKLHRELNRELNFSDPFEGIL